MLFDDKKLNPEAVEDLLQCPIESIAPFTLMLAPIYVFMKLNQKFVSVKAPLDFFLPDELEKLRKHETFYVPKIIKSSVRYQTAARIIKKIYTFNDSNSNLLGASSFEISNEVLKVIGSLWGNEVIVEPFFAAVFAHEFCRPLNSEMILNARETTVVRHDHGLLLSGVFVYVAVHLGWYSYEELNQLRDLIYERTVNGEDWSNATSSYELMINGLNQIIIKSSRIDIDQLKELRLEWSQKLLSRISRIKSEISKYSEKSPSIYGEEGFVS